MSGSRTSPPLEPLGDDARDATEHAEDGTPIAPRKLSFWEENKTELIDGLRKEGLLVTPEMLSSSRPLGPAVGAKGLSAFSFSRLSFPAPAFYDGDVSGLDLFLFSMEQYLRGGQVDLGTEFAASHAASYLRQDAQEWWAAEFRARSEEGKKPMSSFEEFSSSLSAHVRPLNGSRVAYAELMSLMQGKLTIRAYVTQFHLLRSRTSSVLPDDFLLHLFLSNLRADLQPILALQQPKDLASAVSFALSYSDAQVETPSQPKAASSPAKAGKAPSRSVGSVCTHCLKPGHTVERCFTLHPELETKKFSKKT